MKDYSFITLDRSGEYGIFFDTCEKELEKDGTGEWMSNGDCSFYEKISKTVAELLLGRSFTSLDDDNPIGESNWERKLKDINFDVLKEYVEMYTIGSPKSELASSDLSFNVKSFI